MRTDNSSLIFFRAYFTCSGMHGSKGGGGGGGQGAPDPPPPPPMENHKNIVFFCSTGLDPLNNHKATKPVFNVGPSLKKDNQARSSVIWVLNPDKQKNMFAGVRPPLIKLSVSVHASKPFSQLLCPLVHS